MKPDMSAKAITDRLKKTSELRRLCIALGGERLKEKMRKQMMIPPEPAQQPPPTENGESY